METEETILVNMEVDDFDEEGDAVATEYSQTGSIVYLTHGKMSGNMGRMRAYTQLNCDPFC
jgi:hypothetical protein